MSRSHHPQRLLRRLYNGLYRRRDLPGGSARETTDKQLHSTLAQLVDRWVPLPAERSDKPIPRAIAIAIALAVHSQPHLARTFGRERPEGSESMRPPRPRTPEAPLLLSSELLADALGLPQWEIDELREEVDRRAGRLYKRRRMVRWLWDRYDLPDGDPQRLCRLLFPGIRDTSSASMVRRGYQLYAVLDQKPRPKPATLHLPWLGQAGERCHPPIHAFRSKYVDGELRRAIGRAIGADDIEVIALLDRTVTVAPREGLDAFLAADGWRASGAAELTDLGASYPASSWLSWPLQPHDMAHNTFLFQDSDQVHSYEVQAAMDHVVAPRITEMLRQSYSLLLSSLGSERPGSVGADPRAAREGDVDLYDVAGAIRYITAPVLDWARDEACVQHVSAQLHGDPERVRQALDELHNAWAAHQAVAWCGPPGRTPVVSVQTLLSAHLISSHTNLRGLYHREPDPRANHRLALLLFAAHYFASTPLDGLWEIDPQEPQGPPPEELIQLDVVGQHFWPTWQRLLDAMTADPSTHPPVAETTLRF